MTTEALARPDLSEIAIPGVELTYVSLSVTDPELAFDGWAQIIRAGMRLHSAAKFWLGDALRFGEAAFGEGYAQAIEETGLSKGYLMNVASVCRRVGASRRRENLSFSHHYEVSRLEPAEQIEWLAAAETNGWSVELLHDRVREAIPPKPRGEQPQWSNRQPLEPEPLSLEQVEEIEDRAKKVESSTLPAAHPLWETQARSLARDARALAITAKPTLREAAARVVESAVYRDEAVVVAFEAFEDLRALIAEQD